MLLLVVRRRFAMLLLGRGLGLRPLVVVLWIRIFFLKLLLLLLLLHLAVLLLPNLLVVSFGRRHQRERPLTIELRHSVRPHRILSGRNISANPPAIVAVQHVFLKILIQIPVVYDPQGLRQEQAQALVCQPSDAQPVRDDEGRQQRREEGEPGHRQVRQVEHVLVLQHLVDLTTEQPGKICWKKALKVGLYFTTVFVTFLHVAFSYEEGATDGAWNGRSPFISEFRNSSCFPKSTYRIYSIAFPMCGK